MATRKVVYVPLDDLIDAPRNSKGHDEELIGQSIGRFGFVELIHRDDRTGAIIAGHGRRDQLRNMRDNGLEPPDGVRVAKGKWLAPVVVGWSSADDAEALAAGIALNQVGVKGGWDFESLVADLGTLKMSDFGFEGIGFGDPDLNRMKALLAVAARRDEPPAPRALPKTPKTRPGEIWVLGPHRLICGDSQRPETYAALLGDERADMVWTDPPYGVAYGEKNRFLQTIGPADRLEEDIVGDGVDPEALRALLAAAFDATYAVTRPGAVWFVAAPPGPPLGVFAAELLRLNVWRQMLAWVKNRPVFGRSDYHYQHETLFYGWTPGAAHRPPPDHGLSSLWEFDAPAASKLHPTMKPVALVARALVNHSTEGEVVLDPFAGSGTTLIACEQERRQARAIELQPAYCDVICARWADLTGDRAVSATTGKPFPIPKN